MLDRLSRSVTLYLWGSRKDQRTCWNADHTHPLHYHHTPQRGSQIATEWVCQSSSSHGCAEAFSKKRGE